MHRLAPFAACLALTAFASAQTIVTNAPRQGFTVGSKPSPVNQTDWETWKVTSPRTPLPAEPAKGLAATTRLIHLTYGDLDDVVGFIPQIEYRRSTDGGLTWSKEIIMHQFKAGEQWDQNGTDFVSDGHNAFFFFRSTRDYGSYAVYCYATNDQGQTWQGPLLVSQGFAGSSPKLTHQNTPSTPELDAACSGDTAHCVYEAVYTAASAPVLEEVFYAAVAFQGGKLVVLRSDVPISNFAQPNQFDCDAPKIDADRNLVAITWVDERLGLGNGANKTFVRVSKSAGVVWDKEVDISGVTQDVSADTSDVAVAGSNIYVVWGDNRNSAGDEIYLAYSKNFGTTWQLTDTQQKPIYIAGGSTQGSDVDERQIEARGNSVAITWYEDFGSGNGANQHHVAVDPLGGVGFLNGKVTPVNLSVLMGDGDQNNIYAMDWNNNVIAICGEAAAGEAATLAWSSDGGATWEARKVSDGSRDVDDPSVCVSQAGDVVNVYIEDFPPGGNNGNETIITGVKLPRLIDNSKATKNPGVDLVGAEPSNGQFALLLLAAKAVQPGRPIATPWPDLDRSGYLVPLDLASTLILGATPIGQDGTASWPGLVNPTQIKVYLSVATFGGAKLLQTTDAIAF